MAVANGQLLAYFWLITLTAVLAMVLGGEILIQIGGPAFESAAPIVPLTAAAMSMPALYRTVSSMADLPEQAAQLRLRDDPRRRPVRRAS